MKVNFQVIFAPAPPPPSLALLCLDCGWFSAWFLPLLILNLPDCVGVCVLRLTTEPVDPQTTGAARQWKQREEEQVKGVSRESESRGERARMTVCAEFSQNSSCSLSDTLLPWRPRWRSSRTTEEVRGGMVSVALTFRPSASPLCIYCITHNAPAAAAPLTLKLNLSLKPLIISCDGQLMLLRPHASPQGWF